VTGVSLTLDFLPSGDLDTDQKQASKRLNIAILDIWALGLPPLPEGASLGRDRDRDRVQGLIWMVKEGFDLCH
jgi:hypothetical protein